MARVNDLNTHYQQLGEEGRDVILVHGITSNLALWYPQVMLALSKKFRVTAYDLRGHGRTDLTRDGYTTKGLSRDLLGLMDELEIQSGVIVGHSFGGAIALHLALDYPERVDGVAVVDAGIASLLHLRDAKGWAGWDELKDSLDEYGIDYEWFEELDQKDEMAEVIRKSFEIPQQFGLRRGASRATPRLRKLIDETMLAKEFRQPAGLSEARFPEIKVPVLALYGDESPYKAIGRHLEAVIPRCRASILEDTDHFYLMESPDRLVNQISSFLENPDETVRTE